MEEKTKHNFYDGRGPVPAHVHQNKNGLPGGWVDDTARVHAGAVIGEGADIGEGAVIRKGAVIGEGADIGKGAVIREGADIGEGAEPYYAEVAASWRKRYPSVPVVPNLDAEICRLVDAGEGRLEMSTFHQCEVSHCRAGWAIHKAGDAGYALEARVGSAVAGGRIYRVSTGRWPDFYADNATALEDICFWGAKEQAKQ